VAYGFFGLSERARVGCETRCPRRTVPNLPAETRSRTRVSRRTDSHRRENPHDGADQSETLKLLVDSRYWASKRTSFFQTCKVIAAIFRASVRRAISGRMPLASSAV